MRLSADSMSVHLRRREQHSAPLNGRRESSLCALAFVVRACVHFARARDTMKVYRKKWFAFTYPRLLRF